MAEVRFENVTKRYDGPIKTGADGQRVIDANGVWQCELLPPSTGRANEVTNIVDALDVDGMSHAASGAAVAAELLRRRGVDERTVDHVAREMICITRVSNLNTRHHLVDDHFEVFIVDILSLRAIYFLNLGEQIHLSRFTTLNSQNAVRVQ